MYQNENEFITGKKWREQNVFLTNSIIYVVNGNVVHHNQ